MGEEGRGQGENAPGPPAASFFAGLDSVSRRGGPLIDRSARGDRAERTERNLRPSLQGNRQSVRSDRSWCPATNQGISSLRIPRKSALDFAALSTRYHHISAGVRMFLRPPNTSADVPLAPQHKRFFLGRNGDGARTIPSLKIL